MSTGILLAIFAVAVLIVLVCIFGGSDTDAPDEQTRLSNDSGETSAPQGQRKPVQVAEEKKQNLFHPRTFSQLSDEEKKDVLVQFASLPALPSAGHQLIAEMRDQNSSADSVASIAEHDPALVSEILRIANSAYYAQSNKVTNVKKAVVIMGFRTIQDLIFQKNLFSMFKESDNNAYNQKDLWTHSLVTSFLAGRLARGVQSSCSEYITTAALLHDIGKFAVEAAFPVETKRLFAMAIQDPDSDMLQREEDIFGYNHALYGGVLAKAWKLPEEIQLTIEHHHHPVYLALNKIPEDVREAVTIVYFANQISKHIGEPGNNIHIDTVSAEYFQVLRREPPLENMIDEQMTEIILEETRSFVNKFMG